MADTAWAKRVVELLYLMLSGEQMPHGEDTIAAQKSE